LGIFPGIFAGFGPESLFGRRAARLNLDGKRTFGGRRGEQFRCLSAPTVRRLWRASIQPRALPKQFEASDSAVVSPCHQFAKTELSSASVEHL